MDILVGVLIIVTLFCMSIVFIVSRANSRLDEKVKSYQNKLTEQSDFEERFSDTFKALSSDVLKIQGESFKLNAEQSLRAREEAVDKLVKPLSERIDTLDRFLAEREGALGEQIAMLKQASGEVASEANKLSSALTKGPQVRGGWGEMQVERALELSGLTKGIGYTTQDSDAQGGRTDFIVHLPNERCIIIDSKVSLVAYLDATNAIDDEERTKHLENHTKSMRRHVETLSKKEYWQHLPSAADFVVMAVPDFALLPAVQQDPDLIDRALQKNVVLATFSTLVALLRCIEKGWQEKTSIDKVREIIECGQVLHERLLVFAKHFEGIGNELGKAVSKYNESVASFDSRLLVQARRFSELGVTTTRELSDLQTIEPSVQPLQNLPVTDNNSQAGE